jgi:hypothetical protein
MFDITKRPVVLTVTTACALPLQDAESYRRLLDIAARADVHEAIRPNGISVLFTRG